MISELYQQILPTAQRLLDDLLSGAQTLDINAEPGAPDPTAGGSVGELSAWCLDSKNLRDNIKKILIKVKSRIQIIFLKQFDYFKYTKKLYNSQQYLLQILIKLKKNILNKILIV